MATLSTRTGCHTYRMMMDSFVNGEERNTLRGKTRRHRKLLKLSIVNAYNLCSMFFCCGTMDGSLGTHRGWGEGFGLGLYLL